MSGGKEERGVGVGESRRGRGWGGGAGRGGSNVTHNAHQDKTPKTAQEAHMNMKTPKLDSFLEFFVSYVFVDFRSLGGGGWQGRRDGGGSEKGPATSCCWSFIHVQESNGNKQGMLPATSCRHIKAHHLGRAKEATLATHLCTNCPKAKVCGNQVWCVLSSCFSWLRWCCFTASLSADCSCLSIKHLHV